MQALLIAAFVGIMAYGCDASGAEPSSRPSESDASSKPATTQAGLDVETARRALIAMIDASNDSELKTTLPDLLKQPEGAYDNIDKGTKFYFGPGCYIALYKRTWSIIVLRQSGWHLHVMGQFRQKGDGDWEAVETSRGRLGVRGGVPADN